MKFFSRGSGYTLFLTQKEAVLAFPKPSRGTKQRANSVPALHLRFDHADPRARITGQRELPGKTNYFVSGNAKAWHTSVSNYSAVEYRQIYPGVDAVFHGDRQRLEFDFDVAPGADPGTIAFDVDGARDIRVDKLGNIVLKLRSSGQNGVVSLEKPLVFQEKDGQRKIVTGNFVLHGSHRIGFELGEYDRALPIVIDPTVSYSTYLGSTGGDNWPGSISVDSTGSAYVVGYTDDTAGFPGSTVTADGGLFIAKFTPDGSQLMYTAIFPQFSPGVSVVDSINVAVDGNGSAYIVGASSENMATPGAYQNSKDGLTVVKLSPDGSQIVYAAQIGPVSGATNDIAADTQGNAYVVSTTNSSSFPTTPGAWQSTWGCQSAGCTEAIVTKLSSDGSQLVYSTFLGGSYDNWGTSISVDGQGDAYIAGVTESADFPITSEAVQTYCLSGNQLQPPPAYPNCGDTDAFLTELNPAGSGLVYSSYLGNGLEAGVGAPSVTIDAAGEAYLSGTTISNMFGSALSGLSGPTNFGPSEQCTASSSEWCVSSGVTASNAFVAKLSASGSQLIYLGFLGGYNATPPSGTTNGMTWGNSVAVDSSGRVFLAGTTDSSFYPVTPDALQGSASACTEFLCPQEVIFTIIDPTLSGTSSLLYSTFLSGSQPTAGSVPQDQGTGVAVDNAGNAYLVGDAYENGFPTTTGSFQPACPGTTCRSLFVVKFNPTVEIVQPFANFSPAQLNFGSVNDNTVATQTETVTNTGNGALILQGAFFNILGGNDTGFSYTEVICNEVAAQFPVTLNANQSCTVTVEFDPFSTTGTLTANLYFDDNAGSGESNLPISTQLGSSYVQALPLSGLGVIPPPTPDFTISTSSPVTVTQGGSGQSTITVAPLNGFADPVNLSASGSPAGVKATFNPSQIEGGSGTSALTLTTSASTPTGTSFITITGADPNTNVSHTTTASLVVTSSGSGGGGGGSCTCSASGFAAPNQGVASKNNAPSSPHNKYTATATATNLTVTRVKDGMKIINNLSLPTGFAWGFSPDDDRLLIDTISGNQESVSVYDLTQNPSYVPARSAGQPIGQTPVLSAYVYDSNTPSRLFWSPSGTYLLFAALTDQDFVSLYVYNVLTHTQVVDTSFTFQTPSSGSDKLGMASWGFSSGAPEVSFLYDYVDSSGSANLNVMNLDSGITVYSSSEPAETKWQFTACGDALQVTLPGQTAQLYSTIHPNTVIPTSSYSSCSAPNAVQSNYPVVVEPIDQTTGATPSTPVTLLFSGMPTSTQVSLTSSSTPPSTPTGFQFGNPPVYFDLTATPSFPSGASVTICVNFSATAFKNASSVTLQHYVNGVWVNLVPSAYTVTLDTANDVLCVSGVNSFSPFALVESVSLPATPTVQLITTMASSAPPTTDANGNYIVSLLVTNSGNVTATGTELAGANLISVVNGATRSTPTSAALPAFLGDIGPGGSLVVPVSFPASAGTPGNAAVLRVGVAYSGGSAAGTLRLTLP
ncbi:MAG: SBBP repeat-containing protein [Candidatus Acidiferrales bacterium]